MEMPIVRLRSEGPCLYRPASHAGRLAEPVVITTDSGLSTGATVTGSTSR
jgi:hypothetical protein